MRFRHILVVCVGNICRSPVGERLFAQQLPDRFEVKSAGLGALVGKAADESAQAWAEQQGVDLSGHCAQQLDRALVDWADLILVMEKKHRDEIGHRYPAALGKTQLLGQWSGQEVPDPYRKSPEAFAFALGLVADGVTQWSKRLDR